VTVVFSESVVEEAALAWLKGLGYTVLFGPEIAPDMSSAEREDYGQVVLEGRLRQALQQLNPQAPPGALDEAFRRLTRPDSPSLVANNHAVHRFLVEGVPVEYRRADGSFRGDLIRVLDHDKPDNNEFLAEVRGLPQRNLAVETLHKLLEGEIKTRRQKNTVQARSFAEMLEGAIRRDQNRAIEAATVIEELIAMAQEMRQADQRGEDLGLSEEEIAFYDALEVKDSAVKVLGDQTLRAIAQELVRTVRNNVTIDWTLRENVRAKMRVMVKRILRRFGYPPDKQEKETQTLLEQAEVLCRDWAVA